MPPKDKADEEMKVLATGDVHFTTTTTSPETKVLQPPSGLGKVLAGAAITAGLLGVPAAGVAGYFLSQALSKPPVSQIQPIEDQSLDLGLLRIDDLKLKE